MANPVAPDILIHINLFQAGMKQTIKTLNMKLKVLIWTVGILSVIGNQSANANSVNAFRTPLISTSMTVTAMTEKSTAGDSTGVVRHDFSQIAIRLYEAYEKSKEKLRKDDYSTYLDVYGGKLLFLNISTEKEKKYYLFKTPKYSMPIFSVIDQMHIVGFTYGGLKSLYGKFEQTGNNTSYYGSNSNNRSNITDETIYVKFLPLCDALLEKYNKKQLNEHLNKITEALKQIYANYGAMVRKYYDVKETGNEIQISIPKFNSDVYNGLEEEYRIIAFFKDGKYEKAEIPEGGKCDYPDSLRWAGSGSSYWNNPGSCPTGNGQFLDFDWNKWAHNLFISNIYDSRKNSPWLDWLFTENSLVIPYNKIFKQQGLYQNLKYKGNNGKIYTNLIYAELIEDHRPGLVPETIKGFTTKELIQERERINNRVYQEYESAERTTAQKERAKFNRLVARCKAGNFIGLDMQDLEDLKNSDYIVAWSSYNGYAYGTQGRVYINLRTKWGGKYRVTLTLQRQGPFVVNRVTAQRRLR